MTKITIFCFEGQAVVRRTGSKEEPRNSKTKNSH